MDPVESNSKLLSLVSFIARRSRKELIVLKSSGRCRSVSGSILRFTELVCRISFFKVVGFRLMLMLVTDDIEEEDEAELIEMAEAILATPDEDFLPTKSS